MIEVPSSTYCLIADLAVSSCFELAAADPDDIPDKFVGGDKSNDDKGYQDRGLNAAQKLF